MHKALWPVLEKKLVMVVSEEIFTRDEAEKAAQVVALPTVNFFPPS